MQCRGQAHCFSFLGERITVDEHHFLQDCYQLKEKFQLLYDSSMNGGFVMNTIKKGSGVPFYQALEQCYKQPAKVSGGIIGVTRKKDAVALDLWGISNPKTISTLISLRGRMTFKKNSHFIMTSTEVQLLYYDH